MILRLAVLALALLGSGCRIGLEATYEPPACTVSMKLVCTDAESYQDFASITDNILNRNCTGSSCHEKGGSAPKALRLIFDQGVDIAYQTLVNNPDPTQPHVGSDGQVFSDLEVGEDIPLVAPGEPDKSYLLYAMHGIPQNEFGFAVAKKPPQVGYMPYNSGTLCCQKLDAIQRWIAAGAHNDVAP
jgi:hypothetical protein